MTKLSETNGYHRTDNATATAADIATGKTAYIAGGQATGTLVPAPPSNGIIIEVQNPVGAADTSYFAADDGGVVLTDTNIGALTSPHTWDLDANGYAWCNSGASKTFLSIASMPAYTTQRKYELWGAISSDAPTNYIGINLRFNITDGNNFWELRFAYNEPSAGAYGIQLFQVTGGGYTSRADDFIGGAVDQPCQFHIIVYERGDTVWAMAYMFETDTTVDDDAAICSYSVASRQGKTDTQTLVYGYNDPTTQYGIRGLKISE